MAVNKKFPRYPNYDFLQLEEINQTIYNYCTKPFSKRYCIDLAKIIERYSYAGDSKGIKISIPNFHYDFVIMNCKIVNNVYTYTFEIRNTLWTGKWWLYDHNGKLMNIADYVATTDNKHGNTLKIYGENLRLFKLCLELSNINKTRYIETNEPSMMFESDYVCIHQFDKKYYQEVKVLNTRNGKPIEGATVKLIPLTDKREYVNPNLESEDEYPYLKSYTTTTNEKGIARILLYPTKTAGTFYATLEATKDNSVCYANLTNEGEQAYTREVEVVYEQEDTEVPSESEFEIITPERVITSKTELHMYKGEIKSFKFNVKPINKYGVGYKPKSETYQVDIYHTYDIAQNVPLIHTNHTKEKTFKQTAFTDKNGDFSFKLSSREFYGDTSSLVFVLPETSNFEKVTSDTFTINHEWLYVKDYAELKSVCESSNGADAVVLKNQTYDRTDNRSININRKQYVLGAKGAKFATIHSNYSEPVFTLKAGKNTSKELMNMLVLNGIKVYGGATVIRQEGNSSVGIRNCVFQENRGTDDIGAVLDQTDTTCKASIIHNYFYNNYGNNIRGRGNVRIISNLFKVDDFKYTVQPEPFVLEQYEGTGLLQFNQFYINTSMDYSSGKPVLKSFSKNRSYAKISVWVGRTAKVNGKGVNELEGNNTFNFFDAPYHNKAYIFCIYWYPYEIQDYLVACASGSRINKATGHSYEGRNWAFRDGYDLPYEKYKNYSTENPFITIKNGKVIESPAIYVPSSGGVV